MLSLSLNGENAANNQDQEKLSRTTNLVPGKSTNRPKKDVEKRTKKNKFSNLFLLKKKTLFSTEKKTPLHKKKKENEH